MFKLFKPNDWYPVWTKNGIWEINDTLFGKGDYLCYFEIMRSNSRKSFKLRCKGHSPKKHPMYSIAVQKLNEFINGRQP